MVLEAMGEISARLFSMAVCTNDNLSSMWYTFTYKAYLAFLSLAGQQLIWWLPHMFVCTHGFVADPPNKQFCTPHGTYLYLWCSALTPSMLFNNHNYKLSDPELYEK